MSALDGTSDTFGKGYAPEQKGSHKLYSAPADRNTKPILDVMKTCMPSSGKVLGIAEGSGQHVTAFAREFPGLTFQPTEIEEMALESIGVYTRESGLANILPSVRFDCIAPDYGPIGARGSYSAIYTINCTIPAFTPSQYLWPCPQ